MDYMVTSEQYHRAGFTRCGCQHHAHITGKTVRPLATVWASCCPYAAAAMCERTLTVGVIGLHNPHSLL